MSNERKPQRPRIDAICNAIRKGEYDDKIADIQQAIVDRQQERRAQLLTQLQEIYGPGATINLPRGGAVIVEPTGPQEDPDGIPPTQKSALDVDDDEKMLSSLPTPIRSGPDPEIVGDGEIPQFGPAFGPGGEAA